MTDNDTRRAVTIPELSSGAPVRQTDLLLIQRDSVGYKAQAQDVAKAALESYRGTELAGARQSVKEAIDQLAAGGVGGSGGGMTASQEARLVAVEAALDTKADKLTDTTAYRPFGLFYANYGGPKIRASVRQSAEAIARFAICVFSYPPNLENSCPAEHLEIMRLARQINPQLRIYGYITASSAHNGYTLNADGSWADSPAQQADVARIYNHHELIQFFHDLRHVGGTRTGVFDEEGYEIMEGGFPFDGPFLDEFGADISTDAKHYQGGKSAQGGWRWETPADKWIDIVSAAHACGLSTVSNAWESEQMLRECTVLTSEDCVLVETCEFGGDENVANDTDVYWTSYASAQRIYDYAKSEAYNTRGARVVSYNTLNVNFNETLKRRAFTWAVFNTLAMGGHYVYVSHTDALAMPEAVELFKTPEGDAYTITRMDKGWYKLEANGHVLETIRKNADAGGLVNEANMDNVFIRVDGQTLRNACVTAPEVEYALGRRVTEAEAVIADALSNKKANASEYVRMQIDDWKTTVTPEDFVNLFPESYNDASSIDVTVSAAGSLYNVSGRVINGWGWHKAVYSAETLAPLLGKTLELGCASLTVDGMTDFSNGNDGNTMQCFMQLDDGEKVFLQAVTSNASRCGNLSGVNIQMTIPANASKFTIGWQCYGTNEGAAFSMEGVYLADIDGVEEAAAKSGYTNLFPTSANNVSAVLPSFYSDTDASGKRRLNATGVVNSDWGVWRMDVAGASLEPFLGHRLELGCEDYEILNSDGTPYAGANLPLILGAAWNSSNAIYPGTSNPSEAGLGAGPRVQYTVPEDAAQFSVGWQGYGGIEGLTFTIHGLYLYDLAEEGVTIRGRDPANAWLRVCRVTEAALAKDTRLVGNALYITDAGNMFITDYSGVRTDIVVH